MSVNRYALHPDLETPEDSLMAMLDENVRPLLPYGLPKKDIIDPSQLDQSIAWNR